jgi:hypothetical protein
MSDDENNDDFDLNGIDDDANSYRPPERPSQRREARKLTALIERILATKPQMETAAVRLILARNRSSRSLPENATFNREFASICQETRDRLKNVKGVRKPPPASIRAATPPGVATPEAGAMPFAASAPPAAVSSDSGTCNPILSRLPVSEDAVQTHPLSIYGGMFGGKVWKHGTLIRNFFKAVEYGQDDATLKSHAIALDGDATARSLLVILHPKDRSIFEAALALP